MSKYTSTLLPVDNSPAEIKKSILDLLDKVNTVAGIIETDNSVVASTVWEDDFLHSNTGLSPWVASAISSGTMDTALTSAVITPNHPGVVRIRSSATSNAGILIRCSDNRYVLAGGEKYTAIFRPITAFTNRTMRAGFHNATTVTAPTNGVYFIYTGTSTLSLAITNAGTTLASGLCPVTMTLGVWYRIELEFANDLSTVTAKVYDSDTGILLNSVNILLSTFTVNQSLSPTFIATESSVTASDILELDFVQWKRTKQAVR